ncbi:uncharacterized protein J4E84_006652 [Alternaria hordeiaustralica]|uniref:uncharacterized protein n=1 Tax=Alternaria hordeiaustralica TaxID=1187925 RepID=UPI0020C2E88B|nr:uncharacterized protein J4E84_006652 [Alternaria hordeiaustralica]KAI4683813.1 hypothetical protein J4E84_006652 [Alternaria hordeiaustralica]
MISGRYHEVLERLGKAEPSTVDECKAVLERIRVNKGHIDEDYRLDLEKLSHGHRDRTFISQQLYSSKYRFLYELVQNADDSLYNEAHSASVLPFLRFKIAPDAFIVETNEDGFRLANVEAVCATGESSKKSSATDDHIGEKGFGFKSVFSIAEEVHVQSGLWSFRFQHRRGDDGLGMVTPLDAEPVPLPEDVTTRITLRLARDATAEYQGLLNAVASMPDTTLFFLQRLRRFRIHVTNPDLDDKEVTTTFERIALESPPGRVLIRRQEEFNDEITVDESLYRCFTHVVENMPAHEYREGRGSARVELAFPVDSTTQQPKLSESGHHVFAYLPLQRLQQIQVRSCHVKKKYTNPFRKFLIQSDFVTSASRESVVDCTWNEFIFHGVAKTFAMAVEEFTNDGDPLEYSWLDYLPTGLSDDRWKLMRQLITKELAEKTILQTWRQRRLRRPGELRLLQDNMLHGGKPILEAISGDVDLAPDYIPKYVSEVFSLGVRWAGLPRMMKRLETDVLTVTSRLKTTEPHDAWHVAFASLFLQAWSIKAPDVGVQNRLRKLAIIPLQNRRQWTGAPGQSSGGSLDHIYFSDVDGINIPSSIGLNLLDTHASSNPTRKAFYTALGVEECSHEFVVDRIKQIHGRANKAPADIPSHLRYLFCANEEASLLKQWIWVPTTSGHVRDSATLYFPSEEAHHLYQALAELHPSRYQGILGFVDKSLVDWEENSARDQRDAWKKWLEQATGARYYPPLVHENAKTSLPELSPALMLVHLWSGHEFLDMLREHWRDYQKDISRIEDQLRHLEVPCAAQVDEPDQFEPLQDTYLPTVDVIDEMLNLDLTLGKFRILDIPGFCQLSDNLDKDGRVKWRFLEEFGVRSEVDLEFYECALQGIRSVAQDPDLGILEKIYAGLAKFATADDHDDLCKLFSQELLWIPSNVPDAVPEDVLEELIKRRQATDLTTTLSVAGDIYSYIRDNTVRDEEWQILRTQFQQNDLILGTNNTWHTLETCVWHSRFLLSGYEDLSSIYPQLETFFVKHLKVKKVTPTMVIKEISKMVRNKSPDYDNIRKRLVDVSRMLTTTKLDKATKDALSDLAASKFLPKRLANGGTVLLSRHDAYAIRDHTRYGSAFEEHDILLDFSVEEVQIMNVMFTHTGIKRYYLSSLVVEKSTVEEDSEEDDALTQQLQVKAYALYCCAAKYKSVKALHGDHSLFDTLSAVRISRGDLATHLVIDNKDPDLHLSVRSERSFIHHERTADGLRIYVPKGPKQRQSSYRSQLPKLLADIMEVDDSARHDISVIIGSDLRALDDILIELDISCVSWITKPVLNLPDDEDEDGDEDEDDSSSPFEPRHVHNAENTSTQRRSSLVSANGSVNSSESTFVEDVTASSRHAAYSPKASRSLDQERINRLHGALGEAFVFETLAALNLTDFTLDNWRSTIRGELSRYPKYAGIANWQGRETADIVYTDRDGTLTQWLKGRCTGGYPASSTERDFARHPIEYYFEVKSTTSACETRFFLSAGQYKLVSCLDFLDKYVG